MRNILLATTAAVVALTLSGRVFAQTSPEPSTIAPPQTATSDGLVFSKDAETAKPIEPAPAKAETAPVEAAKPAEATKPVEASKPGSPIVAAKPATAAPAAPMPVAADDAPVAQQIKELAETRLQQIMPREQDRAGVLAFYKAREFAPLWVGAGKALPRTQQVAEYLRGVGADGLDPADYAVPRFDGADPAKLAAAELAMTGMVMTFARHASLGRVAFSRVSGAVYYDRKAPGAAEVLGKIAEAPDAGVALDSFEPQHPAYKMLKQQLVAARAAKFAAIDDKHGPVKAAPEKSAKAKGKKSEPKEAAAEPKPETVKPDTIIANMERWRWMPHDLGAAYVMVNIPDYTLKVVQDGKTVWQTKIVVGKPGSHATPLLTETMKYITVNPTWNVPPSIIRNEYLPALAQDPNALSRIGLKLTHNPDGTVRIYQPPGEKNALGRIRFNFPNRFLVYQHDTPDKKLFDHTARAYSHGCMRVQNPDKYAEVLLGVSQPEEKYSAARVKALYGNTERTITFKKPIPVYITYQTVFTDDAGQPHARADIYGIDKDTIAQLNGDRRVADVPIPRNYNSSSKPVMASGGTARRDSGFSSFGWDNSAPSWQSAQGRDRFGVW